MRRYPNCGRRRDKPSKHLGGCRDATRAEKCAAVLIFERSGWLPVDIRMALVGGGGEAAPIAAGIKKYGVTTKIKSYNHHR